MKIINYMAFCLLVAGCANPAFRGSKEYDRMAYAKAIPLLEKAMEQKEDVEVLMKLAESYLKINNSSEAEKWYAKVVILPEAKPEHRLHYAKILKSNEKYDLAKIWYARYLDDFPTDERVIALLNSCDSLAGFSRESFLYHIKQMGLDDSYSNFSPVKYGNGMVFCSEKNSDKTNQINPWNERPYLDLYSADTDGAIITEDSKPFGKGINSKFHEGPCTFSPDGKTIYFTRSNFSRKKPGKSISNENNLKIYTSTLTGGSWQTPVALPFNSDEFSCGHPTLTGDSKALYFISDMQGGFGGTDIYMSEFIDESWSKPENLGGIINTKGNEMFPFLLTGHNNSQTLFFSSDGHEGIGGLDIYESRRSGNTWMKPGHLQFPVNGYKDDFGVMINPDKECGYFSSNRKNDGSIDHIYFFEKNYPTFLVDAVVVKKGTEEPVKEAFVKITDLETGEANSLFTAVNGSFTYPIGFRKNYLIFANRPDYFSNTVLVSTLGKTRSDTIKLIIELDQIVINKPIVLENIYYDYDKWNIRPDAAFELDKLVKVLEENPEITIELSSHTDSRGSDKYNMTLSQKRAGSAVNYIITVGGIYDARITARGYGESKLVNNCKNNVFCSEDDHQMNRRTEFKVTKLSVTTGN
ncbi:MAG: OmpA family protein [Bacteroidota bacterium]